MDQQTGEPRVAAHEENVPRMSRRRSIIGSLIAILALAALGWLAWHLTHQAAAPKGPPGGRRGAPPTTVGVASAETADIPVILDALGTVSGQVVTVRPQVSGVLQKVMFQEGQMVKVGQLLATIDSRPFEMAVMQASGQRERDEAQLDNARITLERYRTLLKQDSIARQDVDTQAALVKQLEGTVTTDRAAEGTARLNLGYCRIVAPIAGRVGLRVVDPGNIVSSGDANGIVVITELNPISVEFAVPQDRVAALRARIKEGASLPVTALDRTRSVTLDTGKFLALDNQVDVQTGTVRAKADFDNKSFTLFPNQFVNARLLLDTIKGAVMVPVTALRHGSNGDFVYVLNAAQRTVTVRPVTRGEATVDRVQITAGLKAGEQVITEGADRLKNGDHVVLPGDKPAYGAGGSRHGKRAAGAGTGGNEGNAAALPGGSARGSQRAGTKTQ